MDLNNFLTDEAKQVIKNTLNLKEKNSLVNEAFAAQPKQVNVRTDFLSPGNIQNHVDLYHGYIKNFNKSSTSLDSADRSDVNSNNSAFRSLKISVILNQRLPWILFHTCVLTEILDLLTTGSATLLLAVKLQDVVGL